MSKNSSPKIALWITVGLLFTAGAVSLLVVAATSGSRGTPPSGHPSTSWYTTQPPYTGDPGATEEPTAPGEPTPVTVVTQTVVAVNPGGGGGDGPGSLIAAFGSLLSGAAAVGTLLHAVHLSRQNRNATARDDDATPAPSS
ncbi:hypothetical protein [Streptomyces cyaneus]|uniref:hypothetical protein n=1 Tax=Streptomyces cyaneus TaxID=1904 RepID=UPI000FF8B144|nr:hypothetical protein [Streptomyces cyaneus]